MKKVINAAQARDRDKASAAYKTAVPIIDRMAGKGVIHKNKAARHKQQLNDMLRAL